MDVRLPTFGEVGNRAKIPRDGITLDGRVNLLNLLSRVVIDTGRHGGGMDEGASDYTRLTNKFEIRNF
jgi:hypothetical protein